MDRHIDAQLGRSDAELPAAAAAHLAECERCAQLYQWLRDGAPGDEPSPELTERIRNPLCAAMRPVKPLPSGRVLAARFLGVFSLLAILLVAATGAGGLANMSMLQFLVIGAVLGAAAVFLSVSLSWQMVPGRGHRIPAPLLIGVFAAGFLVVIASMFAWEDSSEMLSMGWGCTSMGLIVAAPVGALMLWLASRGAPLSLGMLGASLGATSGLLGLTVLQFHCPNQHAGHLLIWHGGVVAICVGAGYLLGRIAERVAARRAGGYR